MHFSRIAFELITFPAVFLFAFARWSPGVRGRPRWLLAAGPLFALCLYTYGPAKLFVPLFLLGAAVRLSRAACGRCGGTTAAALLLAVLTARAGRGLRSSSIATAPVSTSAARRR